MLKQFFPSFDDGERAEAVVLQLKQKKSGPSNGKDRFRSGIGWNVWGDTNTRIAGNAYHTNMAKTRKPSSQNREVSGCGLLHPLG
jgi:hypothetical protein